MASISVFTDQENPEVRGLAAKNSIRPVGDLKSFGKMPSNLLGKTPSAINQFESRSALGDVSNSCSRPTSLKSIGKDSFSSGSLKSKPSGTSTIKKPSDDESPTPRRRILSTQIENTPAKLIDKIFEDDDDIEVMPPNDDHYPDNFDDVWPIAERPTREDLQWLTKFYFSVGTDRPDERDDVDSEDDRSLPNDYFSVLPDDDSDNILELHRYAYEPEIAEELPLQDLTYTGFILH